MEERYANVHGTRESVVSGGVDELEGFIKLVIVVHVGLKESEFRNTVKIDKHNPQ